MKTAGRHRSKPSSIFLNKLFSIRKQIYRHQNSNFHWIYTSDVELPFDVRFVAQFVAQFSSSIHVDERDVAVSTFHNDRETREALEIPSVKQEKSHLHF